MVMAPGVLVTAVAERIRAAGEAKRKVQRIHLEAP